MGNSQEKATMVEDNEVQARVAGNKVSENIATIGEEQAPIDLTTTDSDSDTDSDSVYESDEEEDDDELLERLLILEDSRRLKQLAVAFLHPEQPVQRDPASTARCYFDRASAPEQESVEEAEYRSMALADAAALKQAAVDYLHPELGVVTSDATASARCYFDRASAPEQESVEEAEYRSMVLADAAALKQAAVDYLHPELGVVTSDATASARCYFDRVSAPEQESVEEAEYRSMVLADAAALKQAAVDYLHPELGVVTSDATASARCYFDRASAPEQESVEEAEYRSMVLADAAALKQAAMDYLHPELGVVTSDATASARCYFDRVSAPEHEIVEQVDDYLEAKTHTPIKAPKTLSGPAKNFKTLQSIVDSGIVKSVSSVQLFGLDDDQCDPSF